MSVARTPLSVRFWRFVTDEGPEPCWLWQGALINTGYGVINEGGRGSILLAHRVAYQMLVGPIPEGLELDHLCRVRSCVNPAHLEPVTHRENLRRAPWPPFCPHGHEFTPENTRRDWKGKRLCITCKRQRDKAYYHRTKGRKT